MTNYELMQKPEKDSQESNMQIVRCNKCGWIGEEESLDKSHAEQGFWCPNCYNGDGYLQDLDYDCDFSRNEAKPIWEIFGDVPINNEDQIEEEFLGFEAGTNRFDIWHWFEETFGLSIAMDLM